MSEFILPPSLATCQGLVARFLLGIARVDGFAMLNIGHRVNLWVAQGAGKAVDIVVDSSHSNRPLTLVCDRGKTITNVRPRRDNWVSRRCEWVWWRWCEAAILGGGLGLAS